MADSGDSRKRLAGSSDSRAMVPRTQTSSIHEDERTFVSTRREVQQMLERQRKEGFEAGRCEGVEKLEADLENCRNTLAETTIQINFIQAEFDFKLEEAAKREALLRKDNEEMSSRIQKLQESISSLMQSRPAATNTTAPAPGGSSSVPAPHIPAIPRQILDLINQSFSEYKKLWYVADRCGKVYNKMQTLEAQGELPHSLRIKAPKLTIKDAALQSELSQKFEDLQAEVNRKFFSVYLEKLESNHKQTSEKLSNCINTFKEVLKGVCDSLKPMFSHGIVDAWFSSASSQYEEKCNLFALDRKTNQNLREAAEAARRSAVDQAMGEAEQIPIEPSIAEIIRREVARGINSLKKNLVSPSQKGQKQQQKKRNTRKPPQQTSTSAQSKSKNLRRRGSINQKPASTSRAAQQSRSRSTSRNPPPRAPARSVPRQQKSDQSNRTVQNRAPARGRSQVRKTLPQKPSKANTARKNQKGTRIAGSA